MTLSPVARRDLSRILWCHTDTQAGLAKLAAFWHSFAADMPQTELILSGPDTLSPPYPVLPRCTYLALPRSGGAERLLERLGAARPSVGLLHMRALTQSVLRAQAQGFPIYWADADTPGVAGLRGQVPFLRTRMLRKLAGVFVLGSDHTRLWEQAGLTPAQITACGRLSAAPSALAVNEAEREALADALWQRTVWLACSVPEIEEGFVLAALRETLRESHRSVLILRPENPARGPALKAALGERFVTAMRSVDDQITSDTQVYIADTEGERGLWYRLAVACYLGGTLSRRGAVQSPYDAANLGCAIVHGRDLGAHGEAFAHLADAQATRRILRPDALGQAMCATLRPDAAALLAGRAWDVVSDGADAYEAIAKALKEHLRSPHAAP